MKKKIVTHNLIEGTHQYPDAPKEVEFLKYPHRHLFDIRCQFIVKDSNRELEIFMMQGTVEMLIRKHFGHYAEFGDMSCEMIGEWLINELKEYNCLEVQVLEDGGKSIAH